MSSLFIICLSFFSRILIYLFYFIFIVIRHFVWGQTWPDLRPKTSSALVQSRPVPCTCVSCNKTRPVWHGPAPASLPLPLARPSYACSASCLHGFLLIQIAPGPSRSREIRPTMPTWLRAPLARPLSMPRDRSQLSPSRSLHCTSTCQPLWPTSNGSLPAPVCFQCTQQSMARHSFPTAPCSYCHLSSWPATRPYYSKGVVYW